MLWSLQKHFKFIGYFAPVSSCTSELFFFIITGNKPPGVVPNKFMYMTKDLKRAAEYFDVPLQAPSDPFEVMFKKGKWIWSSEINWHHQAWISSSGLLRLQSLASWNVFLLRRSWLKVRVAPVCPICPQALCRRCALWRRCKNRRKEETSWWSRCPGSCGDGSGARTKTSLKPRRWRRCRLGPPGSVWRG